VGTLFQQVIKLDALRVLQVQARRAKNALQGANVEGGRRGRSTTVFRFMLYAIFLHGCFGPFLAARISYLPTKKT